MSGESSMRAVQQCGHPISHVTARVDCTELKCARQVDRRSMQKPTTSGTVRTVYGQWYEAGYILVGNRRKKGFYLLDVGRALPVAACRSSTSGLPPARASPQAGLPL